MREGSTFYKRLADMLSRKQEKSYAIVMGWLRCRLSFAILRSAIMCIRGTRSSFGRPVNEANLIWPPWKARYPLTIRVIDFTFMYSSTVYYTTYIYIYIFFYVHVCCFIIVL